MHLFELLDQTQIEQIHHSALRVLDEVGVQVESDEMLQLLAEFGGAIDRQNRRIHYAPGWVEQFIADSIKYDWGKHQLSFRSYAGIYAGSYLNPENDRLELFTENIFRDYIRVANGLDEIDGAVTLGIPFHAEGIPAAYGALAEKLYGWKYGAGISGTVQFEGLCPYIIEMYAHYADAVGQRLEDLFTATGYLVSPLRFTASECKQVLYFRSQGLFMNIGNLLTLGGSTPVPVAGAAVMNLAEALFLNIFRRSLWGDKSLYVSGGTMVMDMKTSTSLYGGPEQSMVSSIIGQIARYYGARCGSHGGLTDAKEPSVQAGMQKAMTSLAGLYSCGSGWLDGGLLSIDEVFSPEQIVYDAELVSAVRRMIRPVEVTEETCAVDEIKNVGPGGQFTGTDLTAARFRQEVWEPKIWDRELLQGWLRSGGIRERDRVKQRIREILAQPVAAPGISDECEQDMRAIIQRAVAASAAS